MGYENSFNYVCNFTMLYTLRYFNLRLKIVLALYRYRTYNVDRNDANYDMLFLHYIEFMGL